MAKRPSTTRPAPERSSSAGARLRHRHLRALLLVLAGTISAAAVFASGYAVGNGQNPSTPGNAPVITVALAGTAVAPRARARLEVWHARGGNRPLTLTVVGLPGLPPHTYYEVDLVPDGKPWESCGTFRVASAWQPVTLTLNAPHALRNGDTWVVTRQVRGREGGVAALRQV